MRSTRLPHTKSRRGCMKCRERHVKCDEKRPCGSCIRRSDACSLDISSSSSRLLKSQPLPRNTQLSNDVRRRSNDKTVPHDTLPAAAHYLDSAFQSSFQSSITARTSSIKKLLVNLTEEISSLDQDISCHSEARLPRAETSIPNGSVVWETSPRDWMRDLQLFHHYCSATCITLACNTSIHHVWREVVPQAACSHNFLMHGILAISALHLAHTTPEQKDNYIVVSTQHQTAALELFTSRLHHVTQSNCHAYILVGSIIHMMSTFSIADIHRKRETVPIAHVSQSFKLLRGIQDILSLPSACEWVKSGPLASFFTTTEVGSVGVVPGFIERVSALVGVTRSIANIMGLTAIISPCLRAIESLKHAYQAISGASSGPGSMWIWPMSLSQDFLNLINDNDPAALIILSHFVVLVHPFEKSLWFLHGWSSGVIAAVDCAIDTAWKGWIEWPILCVREATDIIGKE